VSCGNTSLDGQRSWGRDRRRFPVSPRMARKEHEPPIDGCGNINRSIAVTGRADGSVGYWLLLKQAVVFTSD
jgi:hypothetical protein